MCADVPPHTPPPCFSCTYTTSPLLSSPHLSLRLYATTPHQPHTNNDHHSCSYPPEAEAEAKEEKGNGEGQAGRPDEEDGMEEGGAFRFKASGFVSNANYHVKKGVFLLFINNRLVRLSCGRRKLHVDVCRRILFAFPPPPPPPVYGLAD
jgi:hypothetical protein